MNRHSLMILTVGLFGATAVLHPRAAVSGPSDDASQREPTVTAASNTYAVILHGERPSNLAAATRRAARHLRLDAPRLVDQRTVLGRHGNNQVFIFAIPKSDWIGRDTSTGSATTAPKQAKAKPIDQPILETDWNRVTIKNQDALARTAAVQAWGRATGVGQVVAVLDGGFDLGHEFLAGHIAPNAYDAIDNDSDPQDLGNGIDDGGDGMPDRIACHGTFVSSLILSVAPDAKILPIRVLDAEGWGTDVTVASGITWAVTHGATVINMSLVLPSSTQIVKDAVAGAINANVMICSAAGTLDDGWQSDAYLSRNATIVGATLVQNNKDVVTSWSDAGKKVDVFAPGQDMRGALGRKFNAGWSTSAYGRWSGTSFSVPFLSGGAALIREMHPMSGPNMWSCANVRDRLEGLFDPAYRNPNSTEPMDNKGRVDLYQAVSQN